MNIPMTSHLVNINKNILCTSVIKYIPIVWMLDRYINYIKL